MTFQEKLLNRLKKVFNKDEFNLLDNVEVKESKWTCSFTISAKGSRDTSYEIVKGEIVFYNEEFTEGLLTLNILAFMSDKNYDYKYLLSPEITPKVLDVIVFTIKFYS